MLPLVYNMKKYVVRLQKNAKKGHNKLFVLTKKYKVIELDC